VNFRLSCCRWISVLIQIILSEKGFSALRPPPSIPSDTSRSDHCQDNAARLRNRWRIEYPTEIAHLGDIDIARAMARRAAGAAESIERP
jgi:hypothetical protein